MKLLLRQFYKYCINRVARECNLTDLKRSAIVFSPHPDDETLGCGGTIIRKRQAGADIKIVFMTDGSRSHRRFIAENELKSIRTQEAIAAAGILGVKPENVIFLEFKDEALANSQTVAIQKVKELLAIQQPEEVFIPYYKEAPDDHIATNKIVLKAVKEVRSPAIIYEYPIWFWRHWPWTSLVGGRREILTILKDSILADLSFNLPRHFQYSVYIGDVLERKRAALEQHQSQMQRLIPNSPWPTLSDVSNGEFLECFFQEREIFYRYSLFGKG